MIASHLSFMSKSISMVLLFRCNFHKTKAQNINLASQNVASTERETNKGRAATIRVIIWPFGRSLIHGMVLFLKIGLF